MSAIHRTSLLHKLILAAFVFLTFYPFVFLFINSFKSIPQFFLHPWRITFPLHLENYQDAWTTLVPFMGNSIAVCVLTIAGVLTVGCITGFAFARFDFPGKQLLYYGILAMMMVPGVLMLVPSFVLANNLKLVDTYWVMLLFYVGGGQIIAIFLLRNFFEAIPEDLFSAATIDGASTFQMLRYIALPLSVPILSTIAILTGLAAWNNFLWPLVTISDSSMKVVTNGIMEFNSSYGGAYGTMFAGYIIASVPMLIVILVAMRAFMRGLASGAIKS
jgi:ABC-type glycerol-3-phosphate transport system permease component